MEDNQNNAKENIIRCIIELINTVDFKIEKIIKISSCEDVTLEDLEALSKVVRNFDEIIDCYYEEHSINKKEVKHEKEMRLKSDINFFLERIRRR